MALFGGGNVWLKDQEKIYRHAKGLGIADVPHPWGDDRKQGTEDDLTKRQWGEFTGRLNTAKDGWSPNEGQSKRSSDWYRTPEGAAYAASLEKPVGFGINAAFPVEEGGGDSGGLLTNPGTGIGPYPLDNRYFPQLTHAYEAPHAQDISQYMPSNSPFSEFDPLRTYSPFDGMGGLLYQPGTQEYMEQFPMPDNLLNYQPPEINRQPVQYMNSLFGPMEVIMPESEDEDEDEEEYDPNKDIGWDEPYGSADPKGLNDSFDINNNKAGYWSGVDVRNTTNMGQFNPTTGKFDVDTNEFGLPIGDQKGSVSVLGTKGNNG